MDWFKFDFNFEEGAIRIGRLTITSDQINDLLWTIARVVLIIVCMYISIKLGSKIIEKTLNKQKKLKFSLDEKKARTLGAILKSILRYSVYFIGVSAILSIVLGGISLTLAGIGGVAIGLGAQNLVKDVINGFFILFEDQYAVGDYITIEAKSGIVESIELRITKLRDFSGDLHIIPNGLITNVTNHSRGNMRVMVEVDISYEEDTYKAMDVLKEACSQFANENKNMVEGPKVVGVSALKDSGVTIKIVGKAKAMTQWECENQLRARLKKALDDANIEIAYPVTKIVNYNLGKGV
ncbi:mechanosensitive ion channel family protein [Clostridium thermarum]|uniref:mechanosensitive ion channel family protein n=1 Tax=Clostridium thermarum TaxID=1716543 RepID=UPI0013D4DD25|nr:mechanosensitive ion channel family protein [Clostridium thermarum]